MWTALEDYEQLVDKLSTLTNISQLPWKDGAETELLDVCSAASVLSANRAKQDKIRARRKAQISAIVSGACVGAIGAKGVARQNVLLPVCLRYMGQGMKDALVRLTKKKYQQASTTSDRYGGDHPATSDAIEQYFGLADYLDCTNQNMTWINRDC